jgi:polyisoprenoid-binding protein YceI
MHSKPLALALLSAGALLIPSASRADMATFKIDSVHSGVNFKVRHFFSKVPGKFSKFEGTIRLDEKNLAASGVEVTLDAKSVDTGNKGREEHLNGPDFFDTAKFPSITFKSTSVKVISQAPGATHLQVTGDFTMKGVTKSVILEVDLLGTGKGPRNTMLAGFSAKTTINRQDFGVSYGKGAVGDDVEIEIEIEAFHEMPPESAPASAPKSSAPKASAPKSAPAKKSAPKSAA